MTDDLAQLRTVARNLLDAYDRETFMRSADFHSDDCRCSRCGFDRLRATLAALDKEANQ